METALYFTDYLTTRLPYTIFHKNYKEVLDKAFFMLYLCII